MKNIVRICAALFSVLGWWPSCVASEDGAFWRATRNETELYLYASSHTVTAGNHVIHSHVLEKFYNAGVVFTEYDIGKPPRWPRSLVGTKISYGETPYEYEPGVTFKIKNLVDRNLITSDQETNFLKYPPLTAAEHLIREISKSRARIGIAHPIDSRTLVSAQDFAILAKAKAFGKNIIQLENPLADVAVWAKYCENRKDNSLLVASAIDVAEDRYFGYNLFHILSGHLYQGDLESYANLSHDMYMKHDFLRLSEKCHAGVRNAWWIDVIEDAFQTYPSEKTFFMAAGSAHFLANRENESTTMLALLAQRGFKIERIYANK